MISASDLGIDVEETEKGEQAELPPATPPGPQVKIDLRTKEGRRLKAEAEQRGEPLELFKSDTPRGDKKTAPKKNVEHIKKVLVSVHAKVALAIGEPDLAIDDEEGQMLAESGAALLEYYKIKIDGKRGAIVAFIYALTLVYGPRLFSIAMAKRQQDLPGNVTQFPI
jgi:hypothetical protein